MLISDEYRAEQQRMHENERYGAASKKFAGMVASLIKERLPRRVLDYGAGKCALREALQAELGATKKTGPWDRIDEYDPGVKAISACPGGLYDLVCCIDVLEHVEPECLQYVLGHMRAHCGKTAFVTIHTGPAGKVLSDGRNAHLIQKPIGWWVDRLLEHFAFVDARIVGGTTVVATCEV